MRYFNPVGSHESGLKGEDPNGLPNNLMPYIAQVASGKLPHLNIYANDYQTPDGTGVRDYIHVMDLAAGHLKAVERVSGSPGWSAINLGAGKSFSVFKVIDCFETVSGKKIPYKILLRRFGDVSRVYADATLAYKVLG